MKGKKLICLLLCLCVMVGCLWGINIIGFADDTDANGTYKYTSNTGTLEIFSDDIMVDKTEDTMSQYPWFSYKAAVEHIIIYDGVTRISDFAFCRQDNLVDIVIPDSVTYIGTASLAGNDSLKEITVSDNVTEIGTNAFGFDSQMNITDSFQCNCSVGSYAQGWCLKNYIPFNAPFSDLGYENATISEGGGKQVFWSFVPTFDCKVEYSSKCNYDTVGLIYDADNYTYSDDYYTMKNSAIYYNDDVGNDLNFNITADLKAGKRYYLSTRFKLSSRTGSYQVNLNAKCISHSYEINSVQEDFITGNKDIIEIRCTACGNTEVKTFIECMNENICCCDVNKDGYINAKDYAMIYRNEYEKG